MGLCGDFHFSRRALLFLNICYILLAFILIGVAAYCKKSNVVESLPIIGGITACGVFLLFVSVWGLVATMKHHQVMLFFYMLILLGIFVIQFSVACACLAVDKDQELGYAEYGWRHADESVRMDAQKTFHCCGFGNHTDGAVNCAQVPACAPLSNATDPASFSCLPCRDQIADKINAAFNAAGAIGLLFAFTEIVGGVLAWRFRNQMAQDSIPGANTMFTTNG